MRLQLKDDDKRAASTRLQREDNGERRRWQLRRDRFDCQVAASTRGRLGEDYGEVATSTTTFGSERTTTRGSELRVLLWGLDRERDKLCCELGI